MMGLFAAASPAQTVRGLDSTVITLEVSGGAGSGTFETSATLNIWADPPAAGTVFDRWAGDSEALENAADAHTRVLTSCTRASVKVSATYRPTSSWTPTSEAFGNGILRYFVPPGTLRGVITLHHGHGGSSASWFALGEQAALSRDAVAQNYAVVAIDSVDRVNKQWATQFSADNPDIVNVLNALRSLTDRGLLPVGVPRFALGMSNGGGFVARMAYFGGYAGANAYCAQAGNGSGSTVPISWNMASNDGNENVGPAGNAEARANFDLAVSRNVPASYARALPSPVHPRRFLRVSGLNESDSQKIYDAVRARGFLDRNDFLTAPPDSSGIASAIPAAYGAQTGAIVDQLKVCWADHQFFADANRRTIEFFNDPPAAAARQTPRLVNLSTRAQTLGGDDSLIGGIIVEGAPGTTQPVLVRALGPSLEQQGVTGALLNPELQIFNGSGQAIAANRDWRTGGQGPEIAGSGVAPRDDREAAVILQLVPGTYTAIVTGTDGTKGVASVEAYTLDAKSPARFANVSTRARVGQGDGVMIAGLIIQGLTPKRTLLRSLGPSLTAAGVPGALANPQLELRDSGGRLLARNDGWRQSGQQEQEVQAALPPASAAESALVATLTPGAYTVIVRGRNGTEGNALVEAYELP